MGEKGWADFRTALSDGENWHVWFDWYERRLRGGSRGEDYELVFASVPLEVWAPGAAHRECLDQGASAEGAVERDRPLPAPLPGPDAPFADGWTASYRVAIVAGAQNLPFYCTFRARRPFGGRWRPPGRRRAAARSVARRTLQCAAGIRRGAQILSRRPAETGEAGNILIANDQVRILHAMFFADAAMLPEGFASRLKSVIANQFALNAFYDLVQRHNEAVGAGNWSQPFPARRDQGLFRRG